MNVIAHIEAALERGNSPFTLADVLRENAAGNLEVLQGEKLSCSIWMRNGAIEIVHVGGTWCNDEARGMLSKIEREAERRGVPWRWSGRKGWARFVKQKGFEI